MRRRSGLPGTQLTQFGQLLKASREAAGLTQEQLAERAGLATRTISALEQGTRKRPQPRTTEALATALGLAPAHRRELLVAARLVERRTADGRFWVLLGSEPVRHHGAVCRRHAKEFEARFRLVRLVKVWSGLPCIMCEAERDARPIWPSEVMPSQLA